MPFSDYRDNFDPETLPQHAEEQIEEGSDHCQSVLRGAFDTLSREWRAAVEQRDPPVSL